jgi:hypothetical protein
MDTSEVEQKLRQLLVKDREKINSRILCDIRDIVSEFLSKKPDASEEEKEPLFNIMRKFIKEIFSDKISSTGQISPIPVRRSAKCT